jgi:uncharacterized membrane protein YfcA
MDYPIFLYVAVGFLAQIIDGAMGMAYGVSSNTFLLSLGIPPAAASASVHMAEVITTGVSGISHWRLGNIDWKLVRRLLGAYLLTSIDGNAIKPYISAYLLIMGIVILVKAFNSSGEPREHGPQISLLGFAGGFFDSIGGGGWGPLVTTTMVARGNSPRFTIGSVNFSEFFVTFAESVTFVLTLSFFSYWQIILGLLIGGAAAAPLAAVMARRLPVKVLMVLVGLLIVALSIRTIYMAIS